MYKYSMLARMACSLSFLYDPADRWVGTMGFLRVSSFSMAIVKLLGAGCRIHLAYLPACLTAGRFRRSAAALPCVPCYIRDNGHALELYRKIMLY